MAPSADGSSTSPGRPSSSSRRSARASRTSASSGSGGGRRPGSVGAKGPTDGLGARALRDLARRHGIRPTKTLGQHFLADPNLARRIVELAGVGPRTRVLEVGAGLGSLTVALAAAGAQVLAIELDRRLLPALREVVEPYPRVRVEEADATRVDWPAVLGRGRWTMCSNLPYNVGVPVTLDLLRDASGVGTFVIMVQREVGERLVAGPGDAGYGAVSVRVAYRAEAELLRRVPASVFWPRPKVESVLVELRRRSRPAARAPREALFRLVDAGFAERRKTMRNGLRRLGLAGATASEALEASGIGERARGEELDLAAFDRLALELIARGELGGTEGDRS